MARTSKRVAKASSTETKPWWQHIPFLLGVATAVLTVIAGSYGALYLIFPHLEPRESLGAEIDRVGIEQDVAFGDWQARKAGVRGPLPAQQGDPPINTPGIMVFIHVDLSGFRSRLYSAQVDFLDAKTHRGLTDDDMNYKEAYCSNISPASEQAGITLTCWAGRPNTPRTVRLRVQVYDAGNAEQYETRSPVRDAELLDFMDTEVFLTSDTPATLVY